MMSTEIATPVERFAGAAERFCAWVDAVPPARGDDLANLCQLLADLVAAGCALGWSEGEPAEFGCEPFELERARERAAALPFRYYSEIFNNLVVPAEEPVTGNLVDDVADMYGEIAPGLVLYRAGKREEAADHWRFWFASHWGEHATSALRAVWSFLAERDGAPREPTEEP